MEFVYVLIIAAALFGYALFHHGIKGEANIGSFEANELSEGWLLSTADGNPSQVVSLPMQVKQTAGVPMTLKNTLPADIRDGMRLCMRSTRQDLRIFIDDEDRGLYRAINFNGDREAVVSAFLLVDLRDEDAGKPIEIIVTPKRDEYSKLGLVTYAYGNNVWFPYILDNIMMVLIALVTSIGGILAIAAYYIVRKSINAKSMLYLAEIMLVAGMWIISESEIRQIIFRSPSYSSIFAFLLVESVAGFGAMYFNEIQNYRYEKFYTIMELVVFVQLVVNTVLHFTHIADYFDTMFMSHIWTGIIILGGIVFIIKDYRSGEIKNYSVIAWGMSAFIVAGIAELICFYTGLFKMGTFLGIGLLFLLMTTAIQTTRNAIKSAEDRRLYSERMNEATFRTIASTIDAKDEYTGGHSERVGDFARQISEKLADKYGFIEEDFSRIQYIGKMHDIGKIGVPDSVLNKKGRLDDDEFKLMQQHTIVGDDILKNIDNIVGLRDGVRHHHERYDGKGYPDGLKGEEISIFARILCVADCYDAMTSDRVYRKRLTKDQVIAELKRNSGTQFDPEIIDAVLVMIDSGELEC